MEQGLTDQKIVDAEGAAEPKATKWIEVEQKLEKKIMAYDDDHYEILQFLNVKLLLCDCIIS